MFLCVTQFSLKFTDFQKSHLFSRIFQDFSGFQGPVQTLLSAYYQELLIVLLTWITVTSCLSKLCFIWFFCLHLIWKTILSCLVSSSQYYRVLFTNCLTFLLPIVLRICTSVKTIHMVNFPKFSKVVFIKKNGPELPCIDWCGIDPGIDVRELRAVFLMISNNFGKLSTPPSSFWKLIYCS